MSVIRIGRWHSKAFLNYVKTPREQRAVLAEEPTAKVAQFMVLV